MAEHAPQIATRELLSFMCHTRAPSLDECWWWDGARNDKGYGTFWFNHNIVAAHRVMWMIVNARPIPFRMHVLHTCDNPSCVNPKHLWVGTNHDNVLDKMKKGRWANGNARSTRA